MIYFYFFSLSLIFTIMFKIVAPYISLVDHPNHRKIHKGSIPLVGGPMILTILLLSQFFFTFSYFINLIIYSSIIIFIFGFLDDIFNLRVISRLISQFLSVSILIGSGFIVNDFGFYQFTNNNYLFVPIIFTAISIVGLTNSINFIDGLDGLCSSVFITSILSLLFVLILNDISFEDIQILILLLIIVSAFFLMNLNIFLIGKVFLGDSGSINLGFILSCLLIYFSQFQEINIDPQLVIWCVTLPIFDFFAVTIKRLLNKKNPFSPDRTHVHHILLSKSFSQHKVLFILIFVSIFFNFMGFAIYYLFGSFVAFTFFLILFFVYYFLKYK